MNFRTTQLRTAAYAAIFLALAGCGSVRLTHVAPGQSMGEALARKPDLVRMPAPPQKAAAPASAAVSATDLKKSDDASRVAEAFSKGEFCMSAGNDDEAIKAFQEVVRLDPTFSEAWQRLAALYEKKGDSKKALDAFRRSKKIASQ